MSALSGHEDVRGSPVPLFLLKKKNCLKNRFRSPIHYDCAWECSFDERGTFPLPLSPLCVTRNSKHVCLLFLCWFNKIITMQSFAVVALVAGAVCVTALQTNVNNANFAVLNAFYGDDLDSTGAGPNSYSSVTYSVTTPPFLHVNFAPFPDAIFFSASAFSL